MTGTPTDNSTEASAFSDSLAGVAGAALVLDIGRSMLLAANPDGMVMLTGSASGAGSALPLQLDAAMPAIGQLRRGLKAVDATGVPLTLELTFWTNRGARCFLAEAHPRAGLSGDVVMVGLREQMAPARQLLGPANLPGRELRLLAHELRTPLAAVLSLADVMHGGYLGPLENPRHRDYLVRIREASRHALGVIEAMLLRTYADASLDRAAPGTDVNAVVAEVAGGMSALAVRSGARLVSHLAADLPLSTVDGTALRQMLLNLVANSLGHGGGGVVVTQSTGQEESGLVWVDVADNGPGIPQHVIDRIATGAAPNGGGRPEIGLSLTRDLAEANGGRLELASGPHGARARLYFAPYQPAGGLHAAASSSG